MSERIRQATRTRVLRSYFAGTLRYGSPAAIAVSLFASLLAGCGADDNGGSGGSGGFKPGAAGMTSSGGFHSASGGSPGLAGSASAGAPGTGGSAPLGGGSGGGSSDGGRGGAGPGHGGAPGGGTGSGGAANGGAPTAGAGGAGGAGGGSTGATSKGCGKTPTLKSGSLTIQSDGKSRKYMLRLPDNYDNKKPYRLIMGFHGATGNATEVAGGQNNNYFGLYSLASGSTIFVATEAVGGIWAATDVTYVNAVLDQVEGDLCIDTDRVGLEGFSQGAAMVWTVACSRAKTFRFAVGHSGGGLANPSTCEPIAYLGSLGLQEGGGQTSQTDKFAKWNGCMIETLPKAPTGGHLCSDYQGCSAGHPVRWCQYDGGHTPSPTDSGQGQSWMPKEVWKFVSQF